MSETVIVRHPGESEAIWMLGGLYDVKAKGDETGGAMTVAEVTIPVGSAPPPHVHSCGEAVYVLEGRLRYHVGDTVVDAGPGDFFYFPAGTVETFEPIDTVRMLIVYSPGGMDGFFAEAGERAQSHTIPAQTGPPDVERLASIGARYGLQLMAPEDG